MITRNARRALALCFLAACHTNVAPEPAVARVNGEDISKAQFQEVLGRNLRRYGNGGKDLKAGMNARIQESVLRRMIDEQIIAQKAQSLDISVQDAELEQKLTAHKQRFRSPESFKDYLARSNNTEAVLREELRKSLLRDKVIDQLGGPIEVTADEVARYYQENPEHFTKPEQMRLHRLWLPYPAGASASRQRDVLVHARKLTHGLSPSHFPQLCRTHSKGPEAQQEGDLGLVLAGRFTELDRAIAAGLKIGAISEPLAMTDGVAVFRLDAHMPKAQKPLAEVEPSIRTALLMRRRNEKRQEVLRALQAEAKVQQLISFEVPAAAPGKSPSPSAPVQQPTDAATPTPADAAPATEFAAP